VVSFLVLFSFVFTDSFIFIRHNPLVTGQLKPFYVFIAYVAG